MTVDTEGLTNVADFVGKRHLHGMKAVAGVLEHLSYPYFSSVQRRPEVLIDCCYLIDMAEVQASVLAARRTHADNRDVSRLWWTCRCPQPVRCDRPLHQVTEARLYYGTTTFVDQGHL